ncbi:hypothetical protein SDC9_209233 [bioreactor metagenome]|uniref:Uncharacterized protein n=1 Tax=bioreactor metagenome TaxID=1076179 RepID=A0A645JDG0_9ZZZZ
MGGRFEMQVVYGHGRDIAVGMTPPHHAGHHVDPFHKLSAEEAAVSVDVFGHDILNLLSDRFRNFFRS